MREEEVRMTPGFLSFRGWVDGVPNEEDKVKTLGGRNMWVK